MSTKVNRSSGTYTPRSILCFNSYREDGDIEAENHRRRRPGDFSGSSYASSVYYTVSTSGDTLPFPGLRIWLALIPKSHFQAELNITASKASGSVAAYFGTYFPCP